MSTKDNQSNSVAVKYLGIALIASIICFTLCILANQSYNTYVSMTKEKIEVQTANSNSI